MNKVLFLALVCLCVGACQASISCMDSNGQPVDWFVVLKVPNSYNFAYLDSNNPSKLSMSSVDLTSQNQAVFHTLSQIYNNAGSNNVGYAMYDDEKPSGSWTEAFGHTKGDVAFDESTGFWLVHSVPRWPNPSNASYDYPHRESVYGQSFLCMTFATSSFDEIGQQLMFTDPWVYDKNLPDAFANKMPNLASVLNNAASVQQAPYTRLAALTTVGGQQFTSLAKFKTWGKDFYEFMVAPAFETDFAVESWQNGSPSNNIPNYCPPTYKYKVENIAAITIDENTSYGSHKDHSKWAVSTSGRKIVCLGGINRQFSQEKRSGGTVCIEQDAIWGAFNSILQTVSKC